MIFTLGDRKPVLADRYYIAPSAAVIGDVIIENEVSIWFNAVLRGDNDTIRIGKRSNIQDGSVLHVDEGIPLTIGEGVTIGHKVMLHGCTIGDGSLVGMNAVVLNHVVIGRECLIGANALLTEGTLVPDRSLVLGSPAKVIKPVSEEALEVMQQGARHYVDKIDLYRGSLHPLSVSD